MLNVFSPSSSIRLTKRQRQIGCLLIMFLGLLVAVTAYLLYLQNPQPSFLSIALTGLGFLVPSLATIIIEKGAEGLWGNVFGNHSVTREHDLCLALNFEDVFRVSSPVELLSTLALVPISFIDLHKYDEINLLQPIIITGPSGVGKTRLAIKIQFQFGALCF